MPRSRNRPQRVRTSDHTTGCRPWIPAVGLLAALVLSPFDTSLASGTFVPPPIPQNFKDIPINEKIAIGDALFHGKPNSMTGPLPGKPCIECHMGDARLKRKRLIDIRDHLEEAIAKEHLLRYRVPGDEMTIKCLYYYLYSRWRLQR